MKTLHYFSPYSFFCLIHLLTERHIVANDVGNITIINNISSSNSSLSCMDYTSCSQCSSFDSCHWCDSDFTCHKEGSWDSCWISSTCLTTHPCVRNESQKIGMRWSRIALVCFAPILVALFIWFFYNIWKIMVNANKKKRSVLIIILFIGLSTVVVSIIVLYPIAPLFEACTGRVAWLSIINDIRVTDLKASFKILFSLYNPNPYDIELKQSYGTFSHRSTKIGVLVVDDMSINALSITDSLVDVTFDPQEWQSLSVIADALSGTLRFTLDIDLDLMFPFLRNLTYVHSLQDYPIDLGLNTKLKTSGLCQCYLF